MVITVVNMVYDFNRYHQGPTMCQVLSRHLHQIMNKTHQDPVPHEVCIQAEETINNR